MKVILKTKNLELNKALRDFIDEKLGSLERFSKIFNNKEIEFNSNLKKTRPRSETWLEIEKTTRHHQKGPFFRAECQMRFPQKSLRSVARAEDLRMAITEVRDELQRQLKQYKNKLAARAKRGARAFKKELKLSPQARFYRKGRIREEGI